MAKETEKPDHQEQLVVNNQAISHRTVSSMSKINHSIKQNERYTRTGSREYGKTEENINMQFRDEIDIDIDDIDIDIDIDNLECIQSKKTKERTLGIRDREDREEMVGRGGVSKMLCGYLFYNYILNFAMYFYVLYVKF